MVKRYKNVAVGGTFDLLHKGHICLIKKALEVGSSLTIGLISDEMLNVHPKNHPVASFDERRKVLLDLVEELGGTEKTKIVPLNDPYGPAVTDEAIDALVTSYETFSRGNEINVIRRKKGLKPLKLLLIDTVLAEDGLPVSTTRIRRGDIDAEGRT